MANTKVIYIGEMETIRSPDCLKTTVGSCIALILYDKRQKTFGMAHIMLPTADTKMRGDPGKYADTAIMALIKKLHIPLAGAHRLQAKMAGGANMFLIEHKENALKVGEKNSQAVVDILHSLKIPVLGMDCGGNQAREVLIDAKAVKVFVKPVGGVPQEL
jgi:chemotaxis protein CheD